MTREHTLSNAEYMERIAALKAAGHDRVRVVVSPLECARLVQSYQDCWRTAPPGEPSSRAFLKDLFGATEWVWSPDVIAPAIEAMED